MSKIHKVSEGILIEVEELLDLTEDDTEKIRENADLTKCYYGLKTHIKYLFYEGTNKGLNLYSSSSEFPWDDIEEIIQNHLDFGVDPQSNLVTEGNLKTLIKVAKDFGIKGEDKDVINRLIEINQLDLQRRQNMNSEENSRRTGSTRSSSSSRSSRRSSSSNRSSRGNRNSVITEEELEEIYD